MVQGITFVGLDVHKDSITGAALPPGSESCPDEQTMPADFVRLAKWLRRIRRKWGEVRICYEASGAGYVLYRCLEERGWHVEVVAPSLIPKRPGDQRKTDRRDARQLAVLYRAGALTMVAVPDREDEAVRALVRLHHALRKDVLRARHQVLKHLRRNGEVYRAASHWTKSHWKWLHSVELSLPHEQFVLRTFLEKLEYLLAQLDEVDARIEKEAFDGDFADRASRLMCLRGIAVTGSMTLASEVSDFLRFPTAPKFMDYVGLTVSEHSSGNESRRGSITKAGSSHCRHVLIQAAWALVRTRPRTSPRLRAQWEGQPPWVVALAQKAMKRLHQRYWHLVHRGKLPQVAITAVARELAGFVWAIMQEGPTSREQRAA
jgi:transposase